MGRSDPRIQGTHQPSWRAGSGENHTKIKRVLLPFKKIARITITVGSFIFIASSSFAGSIVHKRGKSFIDIEVPASDALVYCLPLNPQEKLSLMVFLSLENENRLHEFVFRRLQPHADCVQSEKDYKKLLKGAKTVRIAGMQPNRPTFEAMKNLPQGTDKKFEKKMENIFWNFIRLETKNGCKAYFSDDCKLPENYSGGISTD